MKRIIPYLALGLLAFIIFRQCNRIQDLKEELKLETIIPDTVYRNRPYKVTTEYKYTQLHKLVTFWVTDTIEVEKVELRDSIITVTQRDSVKLDFHTNFLTHYPKNDKLIQLLFDKNNLSLTTLTVSGSTVTHDYKINTDKFKYNYTQDGLSRKPLSVFQKIRPSIEYQIRPLRNWHDLNIGLNYKTGKFIYEAGFNTRYYGTNDLGFGMDPYLKLRLQF